MSVTLTWTGHATWLVDTGEGVILIDPFFDECPTASMKAKDVRCDAILVTHGHFDHVADLVAIAYVWIDLREEGEPENHADPKS